MAGSRKDGAALWRDRRVPLHLPQEVPRDIDGLRQGRSPGCRRAVLGFPVLCLIRFRRHLVCVDRGRAARVLLLDRAVCGGHALRGKHRAASRYRLDDGHHHVGSPAAVSSIPQRIASPEPRASMNCRHCGTEIADKALICYRCGAATTDPVVQPPSSARPRSRGLIVTFVALVVLAIVGVELARSSPSGTPPVVTWIVAAVAIIIVGLRAYARRR